MKCKVSVSAIVLVVAAVGSRAAAQNLIVNPSFDSNVTSWNIFSSSDYAVTWTGAIGANALGAAQIDVTAAATQNTLVFQQCVAVSPSTNYNFSAQVRFPSGVAQIPTGRIQVQWYTGGGCLNPDGLAQSSSTVNSPDTWQTVAATSQMSPAGATGAMVSSVLQTPAAGTSQLWYDDIFFGPSESPTPTPTPTSTATPTAAAVPVPATGRGGLLVLFAFLAIAGFLILRTR